MAKLQSKQTPAAADSSNKANIEQVAPKRFSVLKDKINGKHLLLVFVLLFLIATGTAGYFYKQLHSLKSNSTKATQAEVDALVKEVGQFMVLPDNEEPTVATVTDPEKLKDQVFFAKAKSGYKVLIYTNAKKAILYDPVEHKIIEVAPINIDAKASGNTSVPQEKNQIPITVVNASKVSGLAAKVADKLKEAGYTAVTVSDTSAASQSRTSMTFELKYSADVEGINKVLNSQASLDAQVGAPGVTITLGTDFKVE